MACGPDAGHARCWPPASRASAIEWAREARLQMRGLAVDDATLERVAEAIMDNACPLSGAYYTAEERADEIPDGLYGAVREYLDRHPEVDGGVQVGWAGWRWTLCVGIVDGGSVGVMHEHRAALRRIGGERVVVERRPVVAEPCTVAELRAIADRVRADEPELTRAGLSLVEIWWDPAFGVVEVVVVGGPDHSAAAGFFAARYGETVHVDWLCAGRVAEVAHPFGCWACEGRRIRVFFAFDPEAQRAGTARVAEESDEQIVIALSRLESLDPLEVLLPGGLRRHHADLELREPVGGRAVIDASAGVVRPSLVQMRSGPDRRWPHPAGLELRARGAGEYGGETSVEDALELSDHARTVLAGFGVETEGDLELLSVDERAAVLDALAAPELRPLLTRRHAGIDAPSSWLEPDVYVPPTLPPWRGDWWWPPASRAMAIEWARRMRQMGRGLAVDDATLERIADAVMDELADPQRRRVRPGRPPPGLCYTAEELAGERAVVESRPPPDTDAELDAIEARIRANEPQLPTANLSVVEVRTNPWHGVVEVHVVGDRDALEAAAEFFAARYGDTVAVRWLGPNRFLEVLHPFASWTSDGRRVRVFSAHGPNGEQPGTARVKQETDDQVVVALSRREPVQNFRTLMGGLVPFQADLELRAPIGARAVIDASAGVVRPSLAQLRSRPRRRRCSTADAYLPPVLEPRDMAEPAGLLIEELELSVDACKLLHATGVQSVGDLLRLSTEHVAVLRNMNQQAFDEIIDALAAHGLSL
jgi:Bacterial RNA polymerase, alpha chain C terminal domain